MNTTTKPSLGDRYSDWAVIILTVVAVLLGWLYMSSVQSRSIPFVAGGVKGQMPAGWLTDQADKGVVLHTTELGGSGFGTTYQLEVLPVTGGISPEQVASLYSIQRAQNLNTVRVLDQQDVTVNGKNGVKITYAYVDASSDLTRVDVPVVVHGADYIFVAGDHAVVASYHASADNYAADFARFRNFLESLQF